MSIDLCCFRFKKAYFKQTSVRQIHSRCRGLSIHIILLDGKEGVNHSDYRRDEPTERSEKYHRYQNGDTKDHKILHAPQPYIRLGCEVLRIEILSHFLLLPPLFFRYDSREIDCGRGGVYHAHDIEFRRGVHAELLCDSRHFVSR